MDNNQAWQFIKENLLSGKGVVLISVLNSNGGSPGKTGFKLAITTEELCGTVGGGVMEFNLINEAREALQKGSILREIRKLHHGTKKDKQQSGLICTGNQTICIFTLTKNEINVVEEICNAIFAYKPVTIKGCPTGLFIEKPSNGIRYYSNSAKDWSYTEEFPPKNILYIAGGGHVGKAVANIIKTLDYRVKVLDNRPAIIDSLLTLEADEKQLVDFENAGDGVEEGSHSYFIILTSSYLTDKAVLKNVINKKLKYIGLMGSSAKIKRVYNELQEVGVPAELLEQIYAPIGIEINSNTAEEIAVSIAAEIIKVKNSD